MRPVNLYDLNYTDAFLLGIRNFVNFKGRASRSEYWRFIACIMVMQGIVEVFLFLCHEMGFYQAFNSFQYISMIVSLFCILPNLAITTRRMHDIGRSGWTQLLGFIPIIGVFMLLTYELRPGDKGVNVYGERTGYITITPELSRTVGLEVTPTRRQDWLMGTVVFLLQVISMSSVVIDLIWAFVNFNGYF